MGKKLYVGNLSYDVDSAALEAMFTGHGSVTSAQIIQDRDTGRSKGFGFVEMSSDAEAQAAKAGIHATVLRPSLYMQMLFKHVPEMSSCGVIEAPFRHARWGLVDARDVAEVAIDRLERGAKPGVHELTGPQALDYAEIAKIVSRVIGRKIHYVDVCSPKARGRLEAKRVSPRLTEALLEYWDFHATSGTTPRLTNEIEAILGRPPRKLAEFVKDHKAEFGGGPCPSFFSLWNRK